MSQDRVAGQPMHMADSTPVAFASRGRLVLLVAAVASAVATAGIAAIPFYTRGEPREALVVRGMLEGGGWVLPLRNGTELPRKPPFFHWIGAAIGLARGSVDEVTVRLPSALFSVMACLLIFGWASSSRGPPAGALTALVTATCFEWMRAATIARVDMVYAGLLTVALVSLDRLLSPSPREAAWRWTLYVAVAAATLTKGPIALVLLVLTTSILAWTCSETGVWRRLRPMRGLIAVVGIAGAWFVLAFQRHGTTFLAVVFTENFHHLIATDAGGTGHAHGALYLLGVTALGLLPWTPLFLLAAPALRRHLGDPSVRLAGIWTAALFSIHMLASAKRAVYLLPAYPALAFLMVRGAGVTREKPAGEPGQHLLGVVARTYAVVLVCLSLVVVALSWGLEIPEGILAVLSLRDRAGTVAAAETAASNTLLFTLAATGMAGAALLLVRAARAGRWDQLMATIAVTTAASAVIFNTVIHPGLARERSLKEFMTAVATVVHNNQPLYFFGSAHPGIVFYARRQIEELGWKEETRPGSYLLIWERDWEELAPGGYLPSPLKVSATVIPHRGHLLLVSLPPGSGPLGERGRATELPGQGRLHRHEP